MIKVSMMNVAPMEKVAPMMNTLITEE